MTHDELDLWVAKNWEKKVDTKLGTESGRPLNAPRPTIYFATDTNGISFWGEGPSWIDVGTTAAAAEGPIMYPYWAEGTVYALGDMIINDNKLYICNANGIQTTDFTANVALWDEKVDGNYKAYAEWDSSKTYVIGDEILHNNNFYVCNTDGIQPTDFATNVTLWDIKVEDNYKIYNKWNDVKTWVIGDEILQGNELYVCNTAGTQATDFITNVALWDLKVEDNYKTYARWVVGTDYKIGDEILQGNIFYICNTDGVQSTDFTTNVALWDVKVEDNYAIYDAWNDTKVYAIGDEILHENVKYFCNEAGAQATDFATNASKWDLKSLHFKQHDIWVDGTTYSVGDSILENGIIYTCNTDGVQATDFNTNVDRWESLVGGLRVYQSIGAITLTSVMDGAEIHLNDDGTVVTVDLDQIGRDFRCTIIDTSNGTQGYNIKQVFGTGTVTDSELLVRDGRDTPSIGTTTDSNIQMLRNESVDLRVNGFGTSRFINIKKFGGQQVAVAPTGILQATGISSTDAVLDKNMQLTMKNAPADAYIDSISALEDKNVNLRISYTLDLAGGTTPKITNPDDNMNEQVVGTNITVNDQTVTADYNLSFLTTRPAFVTLVHGEKEEQIDITWVTKPTVTSSFTGVYPTTNSIVQIELASADSREITIVPSAGTIDRIEVRGTNGFASNGVDTALTTISATSNYTSDLTVSRNAEVRFKDNLGTWSIWTATTNTSDLSHFCPDHTPTVTYPAGQEAIKDAESVTVTPSTTVDAWVTVTLENLETNEIIYVTDKNGTGITRDALSTYNEHADFGIRYFNTRNGRTLTIPGTVFIAHTDVALDMSGTDNDPFQIISRAIASNINMPYKVTQLLMGETTDYTHQEVMVHPVHGVNGYGTPATDANQAINLVNKANKAVTVQRAYFYQGFEQITLTSVYVFVQGEEYIDFPITHANGDPVIINNLKVVVSGSIDSTPVTGILSSSNGYVATDAELVNASAWTHTAGTVFRMNKKKLASVGWGSNGQNLTINIEETV